MSMQKDYTNGELGLLIEAMREAQERAHANFDKTLIRIEAQTTKSNGRIGKLENGNSYLWGAITLIGFLLPISVAVAINW